MRVDNKHLYTFQVGHMLSYDLGMSLYFSQCWLGAGIGTEHTTSEDLQMKAQT